MTEESGASRGIRCRVSAGELIFPVGSGPFFELLSSRSRTGPVARRGKADFCYIRAMPETNLNLRGLKCPLPALKTRSALTRLAAGDELVVECTDPLAGIDIPNLLHETGDALLGAEKHAGSIVFRIRKA